MQVAAGTLFSLGLRADGTLYAWGNNGAGQLGSATSNNAPTFISTQVPGTYTQVLIKQLLFFDPPYILSNQGITETTTRSFIEPSVGGHHPQPSGIARATKVPLLLRFPDEITFGWLNNYHREASHHSAGQESHSQRQRRRRRLAPEPLPSHRP